ncbi:hypothetical protein [Priestia megaterium]|uniref:hypothetical protein n=1 Tax=Priestia megaterium TaxID=1404 RepID=UPI001127EF04|nr:hypothetical protein [Priestia megaterium]TPF14225.1 hypothetical protein CBE78_26310 [Priestia megaterium]TPF19406.1 hypothetical protein CBE79_27315 [Priestia megaterium]
MKKLSADTKISGTNYSVVDFWSWGFSDLLMNSLRGIFAEFLVGSALDILQSPRIEWDAYDLVYSNKKIEVKSSAYIQSWHTGKYSTISFDIGAKKPYSYDTHTYSENAVRSADIYVFCLLKEKDESIINVLNTEQWSFYIVPTETLDNFYSCQKRISLKSLDKICKAVSYSNLRETVNKIC